MRRLLFSLVVVVGLLALAACAAQEKALPGEGPAPAAPAPEAKPAWQEEWERVLAAAKREGRVAMVGASGTDVRRALTEPFERRYGLTVEYLGQRGPEAGPKVRAEREAGQYQWDLYLGGTTTALTVLKTIGALEAMEPALILPEVKDPKSWLGGRLEFADKDRLIFLMPAIASDTVFINTRLVKPQEIASHKDLLDPKWRGKIAIHDPRVSGAGLSKLYFFYRHPALGPDFIRALAKQEPALLRDARQELDWLAGGRFAILVGGSGPTARPMIGAGAPIQILDPTQLREGTSISVGEGSVALFNRAPHPNAARVYLNWLLSKEGQTEFARAMGFASRRLDVPRDHVEPRLLPKEGYMNIEGEEHIAGRQGIIPFLKEVFGE